MEVKWQTVLHVDFSGSGCTPGTWKVLSSQIERQFFFHSERTKSITWQEKGPIDYESHSWDHELNSELCEKIYDLIQSHGDFHYLQYVLHLIKTTNPNPNPEISHTKSTGPSHHAQQNKQTKKTRITINDSLFEVINCKYIHCEFKSQLQGSYSICSRSCESQELEEQQGFSLDMSAAVCCLNRVPWCCKERAG